jgi:hypothetical protein
MSTIRPTYVPGCVGDTERKKGWGVFFFFFKGKSKKKKKSEILFFCVFYFFFRHCTPSQCVKTS